MTKKFALLLAMMICVSVFGCTSKNVSDSGNPDTGISEASNASSDSETAEENDTEEDEPEEVVKDEAYYLSDLSGDTYDGYEYRMDDDFGILPYPKYDENDEYHTAINGAASLAVIPLTVSDPERTGAITEALASYGSMYVLPAFYDVSLKTKYARDDESEEMLDIIKDSIVFDIGYLCGGQYQSHGRDISRLANRDFSSWYTARESAAESDLKQFNHDYGGIEE